MAVLELTRLQVLAHRRRVGFLDSRLDMTGESLQMAARAGLQDSMPRAAVLSVNARVEQASPLVWDDPAFVQLWGPRFSVYVVAAGDCGVFTLGGLSGASGGRAMA